MLKIGPRVRLFGAWIAVLLSAASCIDPKCPSGYDQKGDTCYRRKDAGLDGATMEVPGDDDDPLEDASFPALAPDAERTEMDGGADPDTDHNIDAMGEAPQQKDASTVLLEPDAGMQPPPVDASTPVDPCKSNPCQNGGTCSSDAGSFTCACTGAYTGTSCEQEICGDTVIRTRADVDANRQCAEIRGTLDISSVGLTEITAADFPFLSKIAGALNISGAHVGNQAFLESVTLANLRVVEGAVRVISLGGLVDGPLSELHLPALTAIGRHDDEPGLLFVSDSNLKVLDLPALMTVEGGVDLQRLSWLCTVNLRKVVRIAGDLRLLSLPKLSTKQLDSLRAAAAGDVAQTQLGCCWPNGADRLFCESFSSSASTSCTGC